VQSATLTPERNGTTDRGHAADGDQRVIERKPIGPEAATERVLAEIPAGPTEEVIEQEIRVVRLASPKRLEVHLTPNERRILACLRQHAGAVVSYEVIAYHLYGPIFDAQRDISAIQVYMSNLRAKLEPHPRSPRYIVNYPGVGYALYPNGLEVPELSPGAAHELGTTRRLALPPVEES
jgi:DNA-binding winged helix-turn-helix (wHTH) protein